MNEHPTENEKFTMTEPREYGTATEYAFWLVTNETHLIDFVQGLRCVPQAEVSEDGLQALVDIGDEYDADEAWHYIRSELEHESTTVHLDKIWYDAMWLL